MKKKSLPSRLSLNSTSNAFKEYAKVFSIFVLFSLFAPNWAFAQRTININNEHLSLRTSSFISKGEVTNYGKSEQAREFDFNPQLKSLSKENEGDILLLDFFEGKQYKSIINNVTHYNNGSIGITAKIEGANFDYCYISVSNSDIAIYSDILDSQESFITSKKGSKTHLYNYKTSTLRKDELPCEEILPTTSAPSFLLNTNSENKSHPIEATVIAGNETLPGALSACGLAELNSAITIDILIPYTTAAKQWAEGSGGIDNIISIAMERANQTMVNSKTGITFNLAHSYEIDYIESIYNYDIYKTLEFLQGKTDGVMDDIHAIRKEYQADLVMLFASVANYGGLGYLLQHENGFPDYAFAVSEIEQVGSSLTMVHEIGHNMGCAHHKLQGGNDGLYSYSYGWRGTSSEGNFATVMTYSNFDNQGYFPRIDYFSDPNTILNGIAIGDVNEGNNVLTLKRSKLLTSLYSDAINTSIIDIELSEGSLSPTFDTEITEYEVLLPFDKSQISITGIPSYDCATVTGNQSDRNLNVGENNFTIYARSHDRSTISKSYNIKAIREAPVMIDIEISNGILSPAFDADITEYSVELPYEISTFSIKGVPNHESATVSGNQTDAALTVGLNTFTLTLSNKSYTVEVVRNPEACRSYESIVPFGSDITAQAGSDELNLNLSPAAPMTDQGNSLTLDMPKTSSHIYLRESSGSNNCHAFSGNYTVYLGSATIKLTESDTYTFKANRSLVLTMFNSETPSCEGFITSSAYWAGEGTKTSYGNKFTIDLEANTSYYLRAIEYPQEGDILPQDPLDITITSNGSGTCYIESEIPYGIAYSYIAVDETSDEIKAHSATGDFRSLAKGEYRVYGVSYSTSGPNDIEDFITLSDLQASACETISENSLKMTIEDYPTSTKQSEEFPTLKADVQNEQLHVSGLTEGKTWTVYDALGSIIYSDIAESKNETINLPLRGIYFIACGDEVIKVIF